jgi:predicted small metal-binding protein
LRSTAPSGSVEREAKRMRALECECGKHLEARDDDELYGKVREHVDRDHPEMQLSDEQVAGLVAEGAYDK